MSKKLESELTNALAAHSKWKLRLKTAITVGKFDQDVSDVKRCDLCEFGKWIENGGNFDADTIEGRPYKVTRRLHKEFHEAAASVLNYALHGHPDIAEQVMEGAYAERADKLSRALTLWRSEVR
ncbi:CZB domain-containing protein [Primorskyibacter sp. 2E107]|uniref:CZB domain-containing protein n=1 Tax=Primorskyibacter sp. 2E107 TaxID=3403458 RepID=UPI003AF800EE